MSFDVRNAQRKREKSTLFDAVKAVADDSEPACRRCGASTDLHLSFDFALCVQDKNAKVLGSFYPHRLEKWQCDGRTVTFYPFLIVTKREERDQAVWLPYWHVVGDGEKENRKYGQWAPFMDMKLFKDLLSKARKAASDRPLNPLCAKDATKHLLELPQLVVH